MFAIESACQASILIKDLIKGKPQHSIKFN
jgi:hypothetical protein